MSHASRPAVRSPLRRAAPRGLLILLASLQPSSFEAQTRDDATAVLTERLALVTAITGYEQGIIDTLLKLVPGAVRDRAGDAVLTLGSGPRRRLAACPVDEPGFVVGGVRGDGYLTLRRVGRVPTALFDQQLEGQRVDLIGRRGVVPGVVGVRSIHLTRGRSVAPDVPFTVDDAYVDAGATSSAAVAALGIGVLTPVTLSKQVHRYGAGLLAAAVSGRRAACAALVAAIRRAIAEKGMVPGTEAIVVAFVVEQELSQRGLATVANAMGPFSETVVLDRQAGAPGNLLRTEDSLTGSRSPRLGVARRWSLPVRYLGSPVETVSLADADSLASALVRWMRGRE